MGGYFKLSSGTSLITGDAFLIKERKVRERKGRREKGRVRETHRETERLREYYISKRNTFLTSGWRACYKPMDAGTSHSFNSITIIFREGSVAKTNVIKTVLLWMWQHPCCCTSGVVNSQLSALAHRRQSDPVAVPSTVFRGPDRSCVWTRMTFPSTPDPHPVSVKRQFLLQP